MKLAIEVIRDSRIKTGIHPYLCKVSIKNNLDTRNSDEFEFLMNTLIKGGVNRVIIDVEELMYIDSTALSKIIGIAKIIRKKDNGDVVITRYSGNLKKIFDSINLESFMKIFSTNEEGLYYFEMQNE